MKLVNTENKYHIPLDDTNFKFWIGFSIFFLIITFFKGFWILLVPLYFYFDLKYRKYSYDENNLYVETGIFFKRQNVVPLYRIVNIVSIEILFFGVIKLQDKGQQINLYFIKNAKEEGNKLIKAWEKGKTSNIRGEMI